MSEQIQEPELIPNDASHRNRQLARSTVIVMVAFAVAKVISLAQTVIIAQVFGVGSEWDSFVTANRIPELIFTLISGGALAHAFIPIFSSYLAHDDKPGAWRVATNVINFIFSVTFIVSAVVFFAAPWLVEHVVAPGFTPEQVATTAQLMRILLISTLIFSVSGICMGILQSHNHFLLPALAPIMFDVGILIGVIFLLPSLGVVGISMGAVLGAAMHFGIQVPGLIYYRARWRPYLNLTDPVLWRVIRLMLPRVAGLGVFSLNFLVMNNIASRLGTGSVSALDWGWRLMQIPQTLIGTAIGTVVFPSLAALSEVGDESGKRTLMSGALRFILISSIPSAVGLIVVGRPIISLLERGAFDASASALVYSTLTAFTLGLIVHSALEVVARSFYADKDTLTPLWAALGGATINLVLSYVLSNVSYVEQLTAYNTAINLWPIKGFLLEQGNVSGLALANSLGVMFEVLFLLWILRRRWHGIQENTLAMAIVKTVIASLIMALVVIVVEILWMQFIGQGGTILTIGQIGVQVVLGGLAFLAAAFALRMQELNDLLDIVFRRQRGKLKAA
ncbi:MAG: murein biosynthesis integral membrane protein MurJ [Anaerolineaceae bacterium]|nr:murein biosynthesis integral membrane protein MurJ [Anaerolineaceae bacterium]